MNCALKILLAILLTIVWNPVIAQGEHEWEEYLVQLIDPEDYGEAAFDELYDRLCDLEQSPLNVNTAEMEDFLLLPGLDIGIVSDIIEFRDRYGALVTIEELAMVPSVTNQMMIFLSHFLVAEPVEERKWYSREGLRDLPRQLHGALVATVDVPLYTREGYKQKEGTGQTAYLGDKYRYNLRLTGSCSKNIKYGFTAAKDAGEPLFSHGNGLDYYSFFLNVKDIGPLKSLVAGNFRARFGMGLVVNSSMMYGKQGMLSDMGYMASNIVGHSSRSDNYMQGAAATLSLTPAKSKNTLELTAFVSYRKVDATLNKDDGTVSTISSSGTHRTELELSRKHNTGTFTSGAHLAWRGWGWHGGVTCVYDWFNRQLNPDFSTPSYRYRQYNARGRDFWNVSADYGYISSSLSFAGETATGDGGAIATLNTLRLKATSDLTLVASQRFYSYRYHALHASAFSDGGKVQNESGVYVGVKWEGIKHLSLDAYSDISYSPWLKYQVSASSYSWDNNIVATYNRRPWTVTGRYRLRLRQRDNADKSTLLWRNEHRARLSLMREKTKWTWKTQLDGCLIGFEGEQNRGWMVSESVGYKPSRKMNVSASAGYFHTDNYDSRLYTYERSVLYSFSMPSYFGKGMRLSAVLRFDLGEKWMLMGKVGYTKYFDRSEIGTAHQLISASHQTDVNLQLKWRY